MPESHDRSSARFCAACAVLASLVAPACDIGGGGGGGPAERPLPAKPLTRAPSSDDPAARGAGVYEREGCRLCHGDAGKGGVENANSETAGKINGLTLVKEGYSKEDLIEKVRQGQQDVGKENKDGPTPPLRMPAYGKWLSERDVSDLAAYLFGLYPKDKVADDDWDKDEKSSAANDKESDSDETDKDGGAESDEEGSGGAKPKPAKAGKK